jgi:hypothetical protein
MPTGYEAWWVPEVVCTRRQREYTFTFARNGTPIFRPIAGHCSLPVYATLLNKCVKVTEQCFSVLSSGTSLDFIKFHVPRARNFSFLPFCSPIFHVHFRSLCSPARCVERISVSAADTIMRSSQDFLGIREEMGKERLCRNFI